MSTLQTTVGQWVVEHPSRARVFEKFGIDYCCGGKKPLADACSQKGIDPETVLSELSVAYQQTQPAQTDWANATLTELADHIEATHHAYMKSELPRLAFMVNKVAPATVAVSLPLTVMVVAVPVTLVKMLPVMAKPVPPTLKASVPLPKSE